MPDFKPYSNTAERSFFELAKEAGWEPSKRGWPDFICFHPDGRVIAVEVKPRLKNGQSGLLKTEHARVMAFLKSVGVKCYVSDGEKLEPFDPAIHANPKRRRPKYKPIKTPGE